MKGESKLERIAVLIPCYNEEKTVGSVIDEFRAQLPGAIIYVCDNCSTDATAEVARSRGAVVLREDRPGKGFAVRRLFRTVSADAYLLVDGDCTYPASRAWDMLQPVLSGQADMTVGDRLSGGEYAQENKRPLHNSGNKLVRLLVNRLFGARLCDIMSGYRAFSRRFVMTMPVMSPGFELESEMTLHALDKRLTIVEIPVEYRDRPEGSISKLNTLRDGFRVVRTIITVFRDYKPLLFFSLLSIMFLAVGLALGIPVIVDYARTLFVSKVPSAVLAVGLVITALLLFCCGLVLDTIGRNNRKQFELFYILLGENTERRPNQP